MSGPAPDGTRCSRVTARPDEVEGRRHPASESNRRLIGAGKGARLPLPPNRACASPAHGSPVSGFSSRLARQPSGFDQGEKPFGSEKCIGPATVVGITPPRKFLSLGRATVLLASSLEPQFFTAKARRARRFAKKIKGLRERRVSYVVTHRVNDQIRSTRCFLCDLCAFAPLR